MYKSLIAQLKTMLKNPYKSRNKLFLKQFGEQGAAYAHLTPDILFKLSMACAFAQHLKDFSFFEDVYELNEQLMEHAENDVALQSKAQYVQKFNKHMKKKGIVKDERMEKLEKIASLMNTTDPNMVQSHQELETMALDYFDEVSSAMLPNSHWYIVKQLFEEIVNETSFNNDLFNSKKYQNMQLHLRIVIEDALPSLIDVYPKTYGKALNNSSSYFPANMAEDYWCLEYDNILEKNEYSKSVKKDLDKEYWLELYTYQLELLIQSILDSFKSVLKQSCYTHELNKLVQKINQLGL